MERQPVVKHRILPSMNSLLLSLFLSLGFSILFSSEIYEIDSISSSNYI